MQIGEIERAGGRLTFAVSGRQHAPALLLLHPLGADREIWAPQLPTFEQFFHVVRPTLRVEPASRTPAEHVDDALAILEHLHLERAHWCGVALGGAIALQAAIDHPKRVYRLVIAHSAPSHTPSELAAVQAATLVIAGARDTSTPIEQVEALRDGITGADLVVLDAGPLPNVEQPDDFTEVVTAFLRD